MLFNSPAFVARFLPLCLLGFHLTALLTRRLAPRAGNTPALLWLAACSLAFYAWWNPPFVTLLIGSIAVNYLLGQLLFQGQGRRPWLLRLGVALNLLLLGAFKYGGFLLANARALTGWDAPAWRLFLPLAISFYTFQQVMFLVDSHRGEREDWGFLPYACFVSFFPHLIAGPIVRPRDIVPQFLSPGLARISAENLAEGLTTFLLGLAKKLVIADSLAPLANAGFDAAARGAPLTMIEAWVATLAYGLQIYFDFSGYSDMAIGLARMFNVRFPLNFASPYQAGNISEFWRRWHISLGHFLRDHLYIPLGGNRRGAARRGLNLWLTMAIGGFWHGAAWSFALWGALHGTYLVGHAQWRRWRPAPADPGPLRRGLARLALLTAVAVAWVPFRADGVVTAWRMLRTMAGWEGLTLSPFLAAHLPRWPFLHAGAVLPVIGAGRPLALPQAAILIGAAGLGALALPHVHAMGRRARLAALTASFGLTMQALFFAPAAPFLYFQF